MLAGWDISWQSSFSQNWTVAGSKFDHGQDNVFSYFYWYYSILPIKAMKVKRLKDLKRGLLEIQATGSVVLQELA